MKNFSSFLINILPSLINVFFIGAAIFIISFYFPERATFNYEYESGKLWIYQDLYAPFDFPIYKTKKQIEKEEKEIEDNIKPFYIQDTLKETNNITNAEIELINAIKDSIVNIKPSERDEMLQTLNIVYYTGIIQKPVDASLDDIIYLLYNDASESKKISEFYTIKSAIEDIVPDKINNRSELLNIFKKHISPNIILDNVTTDKQKENARNNIAPTEGGYLSGEKIVSENEIISNSKFNEIRSLEKTFNEKLESTSNSSITKLGYILISALMFSIFIVYIRYLDPKLLENPRKFLFLLIVIVGILTLAYFSLSRQLPSIYLVPYCVVPIVVRLFFGNRVAFLSIVLVLFFTSFIMPYGNEYIFINFIVCFFALLVNINAFYWSRFFFASFLIFTMYLIAYYSVELINYGQFEKLDFGEVKWFAVNGILTLLVYPFIPIFEKIFGFLSNISLLELSLVNTPILKKMQTEAPGTFAHSLQVGNLAGAAATAIGANPLLVKVGALYHDIGKISEPLYFIENQSRNYNPHDNLEPEESADIIIDHVINGVEMAKKQRLPDLLIDFIRTHHGTQLLEYFYKKHLETLTEEELEDHDDSKFRYPGPLPYSKETAILMLADTVEAASRSLSNPTGEIIEEMVERLTKHKIENNQFINADISFKEITVIKKVFVKMLKSIYHVRVAYQES